MEGCVVLPGAFCLGVGVALVELDGMAMYISHTGIPLIIDLVFLKTLGCDD